MSTTARFELGLSAYAVQWSPFAHDRLAVACSQYFGIIGNGRLVVLGTQAGAALAPLVFFDVPDAMYDVAWSEASEDVLATCCGDGSVQVWDARGGSGSSPVRLYREHEGEVYSVEWNALARQVFCTGAMDGTVRIFDVHQPASVACLRGGHASCIYAATWSPHTDGLLATAGEDGTVRLWDARSGALTTTVAQAHADQALTCDFGKYDAFMLASGGTDGLVRTWDIRNATAGPVAVMAGHRFAVRRVRCSPHNASVIASASYDMSVMLWNHAQAAPMPGAALSPIDRMQHHSEFVVGLDFNLHVPGQLASAAWDDSVVVWNTMSATTPHMPAGPPPVGMAKVSSFR